MTEERHDDDWPDEPVGGRHPDGGDKIKGRTIPCPKCGSPVRVGWGRGIADWRLMPGNAMLRCRACGHVFRAPKSVELITRFGRFNDGAETREPAKPSVSLTVFKTGDQDAVKIAEMTRAYVAGRSGEPFDAGIIDRVFAALNAMQGDGDGPPLRTKRKQAYDLGVASPEPLPGRLSTHSDLARFIEGRLDLLMRNARWGALLVC